ncbi:MAG: PqqD family protein [Arenimonas sp.]
MQHITLAHQARPNDEVLFQEVAGEAVLLNLASERYFGLDPVGTHIWGLINSNLTLQQVHQSLCETYDAGPEKLQQDLLALIAQLAEAGLVTVDE